MDHHIDGSLYMWGRMQGEERRGEYLKRVGTEWWGTGGERGQGTGKIEVCGEGSERGRGTLGVAVLFRS